MITEFMDSGSLFDLIHKNKDREKILTDERIFSICEDVALGMNYLHSRKVLHCDLKSSNVLVFFLILKVDDNWNMKLCDFGLSRVKNKIHKKKNQGRIGTPHWMAPEILRQETYEEPSDVYSYGMILW